MAFEPHALGRRRAARAARRRCECVSSAENKRAALEGGAIIEAGHLRGRGHRRAAYAGSAALVQAEQPEAEQRNLLAVNRLNSSKKERSELLSAEEPIPIDDLVERSGLNSSELLATLFALEMKRIVRQLPGKQCCK